MSLALLLLLWCHAGSGLETFSNIDGFGNNIQDPTRGCAGSFYSSPSSVSYPDGIGALPVGRPSPRLVSHVLGWQFDGTPTESEHTVAMLAWGQAVAHDVGDMHSNSSDPAPISVPRCDYRFDSDCQGDQELPFHRGDHVVPDGGGPRRFIDYASAFVDASWLYGADMVREFVGGRLRMPGDDFPDQGAGSAPQGYGQCKRPQVADGRAMENLGLLNMYTVFGREHNRICSSLAAAKPEWSDDRLFNESRMRTIALVQKITLEEYAPALLGTTLKGSGSYDPNVDPSVSLLFSTAAYRYGHSAVPGVYKVGDAGIPLRDVQFNSCVTMLNSDLVIRGMTETPINGVDTHFVTDLRDHLKTDPSMILGAQDLFSYNIQRGRDVGLPTYNEARELLGFPRVQSFEAMAAGTCSNATALEELYGDVDKVDFYVGGLLEQKEVDSQGSGSSELGETFAAVIRDQFQRLRLGDRFWYEWHPELSSFVERRGLSQVIRDNTPGGDVSATPFSFPGLKPSSRRSSCSQPPEFSSMDGYGNNVEHATRGSAGTFYAPLQAVSYADGVGAMPEGRPSPRLVSAVLGWQFDGTPMESEHSVAMLAWGQAVAHDVGDLQGNASDSAPIPVPACDYRFDAGCRGDQEIPFDRGKHILPDDGGPRQFIDHVSAFVDASWLYGPGMVRELSGGRLYMPGDDFPDQGPDSAPQFNGQCRRAQVADGRAMENLGLLHMYMVFGREHNRICAELSAANPGWGDDRLFNEARMRTIALVQKITLEEYAPALLGTSLKDAASYDPSVDPSVSLLFATAAYRYGHSAVPGVYMVGGARIPLRDVQFSSCVTMLNSDLVIRGMTETPINSVDGLFATDLRDHLKTDPSMLMGAQDLFARNIQRGRDVGLPAYNDVRELLGFSRVQSFEAMAAGTGVNAAALEELYGDVDKVDFYVGGLLERKEVETQGSGSSEVGETFAAVIRDQFRRLRQGDRFWYEWSPELVAFVDGRGLQQVIEDNTPGGAVAGMPFVLSGSAPVAPVGEGSSDGGSCGSSTSLGDTGIQMGWELLAGEKLRLSLSGSVAGHRWISVGFGPQSTSMAGVDFVVAELGDDGCTIKDFWGAAHAVAPTEDSGAASFSEAVCEVIDGQLSASLVRPLAATDSNDFTIDPDSQSFLYAAGSSAWPAYHGQRRGGGTLSFRSGGAVVSSSGEDRLRSVWILHALIMVGLFSFGYPVAILSVMFFRHTWLGFKLHKLVGQFSIGAIVITMLFMVVSARSWTSHGAMGMVTVFGALTLAIMGNTMDSTLRISAKVKNGFRLVHKCLGYAVMMTAPVTSWLGFCILQPFDSPALSGTPALWYLPIFCVVAFAVGERTYRRSRNEKNAVDFQELIKQGRNLMVVKGSIIDIDAWGRNHPGGKDVLTPWIGKDATAVFFGDTKYTDNVGFQKRYAHSKRAVELLLSMRIGVLVTPLSAARTASPSSHKDLGATVNDYDDYDDGGQLFEMRLEKVTELTKFNAVKRFEFSTLSPLFQSHAVTFVNNQGVKRDYSPIDAFVVDGKLQLHFIIKIYPQGEMTQWLQSLSPGGVVQVRDTSSVSLRSPKSHGCWPQLLMLAGGTGVTPMLRVIKQHTEHAKDPTLRNMRLVLIWWVPTIDETFIRVPELQRMIKRLDGRLKIRVCFTREGEESVMQSDFAKIMKKRKSSTKNGKAQQGLFAQVGRDAKAALVWGKEALGSTEVPLGATDASVEQGRVLVCGPPEFCTDVSKRFKMVSISMSDHIIVL